MSRRIMSRRIYATMLSSMKAPYIKPLRLGNMTRREIIERGYKCLWPSALKKFRNHLGLTQEKMTLLMISRGIDITTRTFQRWEAGVHRIPPDVYYIFQEELLLAGIIDPDVMFVGNPNEEPS